MYPKSTLENKHNYSSLHIYNTFHFMSVFEVEPPIEFLVKKNKKLQGREE